MRGAHLIQTARASRRRALRAAASMTGPLAVERLAYVALSAPVGRIAVDPVGLEQLGALRRELSGAYGR
jgi:hypothetical protein